MSFVKDKQELKKGVVIFRRGDVAHNNWSCRIKLPGMNRYKTVALGTSDSEMARAKACALEAELLSLLKRNVPVFTRYFSDVAREYLVFQELRVKAGKISQGRVVRVRSIVTARLNAYVGALEAVLKLGLGVDGRVQM